MRKTFLFLVSFYCKDTFYFFASVYYTYLLCNILEFKKDEKNNYIKLSSHSK